MLQVGVILVVGQALEPVFHDGEELRYVRSETVQNGAVGSICLCGWGGAMAVKLVDHGSADGLYDLTWPGEQQLLDVKLAWASVAIRG